MNTLYTTILIYHFYIFLKEINTFIKQGCIKLIKSDSKNIYDVAKDFHKKKKNYKKNPEKMHQSLHKNISQHNCFQH